MMEFLHDFLATKQFIPHGHCYLWKPGLVWLHVISDSLIALAYYSIPIVLVYFVYKRRDLPFNWMFLMFGSFIIACGTTHIMEIWTLWHPTYWLSGFIKAITAFVSVCTAVELVPLIPQALALPSPAQLEAANTALETEINERKQVEAQLQREKEFLKVLLENIEAGIAACDAQGTLTLLNYASRKLYSSPEQRLPAEQWAQYFNLYLPDGKTPMQKEDIPLFRALQGEYISNVEAIVIPKHGTTHTLLVSGRAIFDAQGKKQGAVAVMHDITERKQAEVALRQSEEKNRILNAELECRVNQRTAQLMRTNQELANEISDRKQAQKALQQSEEFLRRLIASSVDCIKVLDLQGNLLYMSPGGQSIMEIDDYSAFVHTQWLDFWQENYHQVARSAIETAKRGGIGKFQGYGLTMKGKLKWWETIVTPIMDTEGKPEKLLSVSRDITERKQVEEELRQSEERFRATFNQAAVGIAHVNPDGRWLLVNQKLCDIIGYTREELLEKTFQDVTHPNDLETDLYYLSQFFANKIQNCSFEKRYICEVGSPIWINLTISVVREPSGEPKYFIGVIEDISERKQVEARIQASLKEKEVLLKEIHHRVKNNLQIISSLLSLQSGYIKDETVLEILKAGENRIASMALVHEQLYQSKNIANINFTEYIENLVSNLFSSYDVNPEAIALNLNIDNVMLNVDIAINCGLIINELVSNSLKHAFPFSKTGEISINIFVDELKYLNLIVSDTGIGFPKDLDFLNTESLGLQIVDALTKQLGGTIELRRDYGTAFQIRFLK